MHEESERVQTGINKNGENGKGWRVGMGQTETGVGMLLLYILFSYCFDFETRKYISCQKLN